MPRLLIVDDEVDVREFAKNFFKRRNIEVFTSSGGQDALRIIETQKPDLVLLDVRMEEMSGIEVLKKLRKENNPVKVVMVTGVEDEETINEATSLGIKGYIHKPLVLEELEKVVLSEL
ncbi:MAG TPA: response regulator [Candidatus Omnitrophota bacterium]|nr:response regulator [Candidatus Omnitrophota bacterium]